MHIRPPPGLDEFVNGAPLLPSNPIRREAEERGLASVKGVDDESSLLELAKSLGNPIRNSSGDFLRELRVTPCTVARPNTLSATFGTGSFPLHTDTAFWPLPARFLIMRAIGDNRRPTTVCPFRELITLGGERLTTAIRKSVWLLRGPTRSIYCEMAFRARNDCRGFRYDRQCMTPGNPAAQEVDEYISSELPESVVQQVSWSTGTAIVVANWQSLHGRGPEPPREQERILQRIYVE